MTKRLLSRRTLIALASGAIAAPAIRAYAAQPLRVIVPFSAGGNTDFVARIVSTRVSELLERPVIIENRPSASTITGTAAVVNAQPNGDTILLIDTTLALLPTLHGDLPFNIFKDLKPLGVACTAPTTLVARTSLNARTVKDVVDLARAQPGKLTFGTGSIGGTAHLAGLLMQEAADIRMTHVPYTGAGQAMNDLLGGHIDTTFTAYAALHGMIETKMVQAIATTGIERHPLAPNLPTFAESGYPGVVVITHWCFYAPTGVEAAVADSLGSALIRAVLDDKVKVELEKQGYVPVGADAAKHAEILREEYEKWGGIMRRASISPANEAR
jgi:tripartite-type tricarboxylate transporter receptor subunit TctC